MSCSMRTRQAQKKRRSYNMRDVKAANGYIVARVDASGFVTLGADPGPIAGFAASTGEIYDDEAGVHCVGRVSGDGQIIDSEYMIVGKVDSWGRVFDRLDTQVGKVEKTVDAGVLLFLATPPDVLAAAAPKPDLKEDSLMNEALDLADEFSRPKVKKDI